MSNWSVVSISFSGLENIGPIEVQRAIEADMGDDETLTWIVTPSCEEDSAPGFAVEWWMTTHVNGLDPNEILGPLRRLSWKNPEQVCIVYKDEYMDRPTVVGMLDV